MEQVVKILVKQLDEKGMTEDEISNCISSLWNILMNPNVKCCQDLNLEMEKAGWQDFELADEVFKMALSALANHS